MKIKIKKLHPNAIIPKYMHSDDAGMDLYAMSVEIKDRYVEYKTGLSFELPKNYVMLVFPRSSITDKDLIMKNCVGVLDSGFRGELKLRFKKEGDDIYNAGERIAQILIIPYPNIEFEESENLSEGSRGQNGLGSTGLK
jgi:dUTP pyrophosphatase